MKERYQYFHRQQLACKNFLVMLSYNIMERFTSYQTPKESLITVAPNIDIQCATLAKRSHLWRRAVSGEIVFRGPEGRFFGILGVGNEQYLQTKYDLFLRQLPQIIQRSTDAPYMECRLKELASSLTNAKTN